jgi:hypothetical protein
MWVVFVGPKLQSMLWPKAINTPKNYVPGSRNTIGHRLRRTLVLKQQYSATEAKFKMQNAECKIQNAECRMLQGPLRWAVK